MPVRNGGGLPGPGSAHARRTLPRASPCLFPAFAVTSIVPALAPASGSQARIVPGPRLAHWWYGMSRARARSPSLLAWLRRSKAIPRDPERRYTSMAAPSPSSVTLPGSAATSLTLHPAGRSGDSSTSTSGPRSTANVPRTASMRGSAYVTRAPAGNAMPTESPARKARRISACPALRAVGVSLSAAEPAAQAGTLSRRVTSCAGASMTLTETVPPRGIGAGHLQGDASPRPARPIPGSHRTGAAGCRRRWRWRSTGRRWPAVRATFVGQQETSNQGARSPDSARVAELRPRPAPGRASAGAACWRRRRRARRPAGRRGRCSAACARSGRRTCPRRWPAGAASSA